MHREIFYCDKTKEGYEKIYNLFKEEMDELDLAWATWQIEDRRFFTREQAFDFLYITLLIDIQKKMQVLS